MQAELIPFPRQKLKLARNVPHVKLLPCIAVVGPYQGFKFPSQAMFLEIC